MVRAITRAAGNSITNSPTLRGIVGGAAIYGAAQITAQLFEHISGDPSVGEVATYLGQIGGGVGAVAYMTSQFNQIGDRFQRSALKIGTAIGVGAIVGSTMGDYNGGIEPMQYLSSTFNRLTDSPGSLTAAISGVWATIFANQI